MTKYYQMRQSTPRRRPATGDWLLPHGSYAVSVASVVLNRRATIAATIDSVAGQDYRALEHIVVDGGSSDGTLEFLRQKLGWVFHLIKEPDAGIADAMNKALQCATGDLVLFSHADDCFVSADSLSTALQEVTDLEHIWGFDILSEAA